MFHISFMCSIRKMFVDISKAATGGFLSNFVQCTGKHLFLLKERLWPRCFPVNVAKFLQNTSGRLLLDMALPRRFLLSDQFGSS